MEVTEHCDGLWEVGGTDVYAFGHSIIQLLSNARYTACFAAWSPAERDLFLQIGQWCCEQCAYRPKLSELLNMLQQYVANGRVSADMATLLSTYQPQAQLSAWLVPVNAGIYEADLQLQQVGNQVEALQGQLAATYVEQQQQLDIQGLDPQLQLQLMYLTNQQQGAIMAALEGAFIACGALQATLEGLWFEKQALDGKLVLERVMRVLALVKPNAHL